MRKAISIILSLIPLLGTPARINADESQPVWRVLADQIRAVTKVRDFTEEDATDVAKHGLELLLGPPPQGYRLALDKPRRVAKDLEVHVGYDTGADGHGLYFRLETDGPREVMLHSITYGTVD